MKKEATDRTFGIDAEERDGERRIAVRGDVDLHSSPGLRSAVLDAVSAGRGPVLVDLSAVTYMDSSGVATLIEGLRAAGRRNAGYFLVAPSEPVRKVIRLARLDAVFKIRND